MPKIGLTIEEAEVVEWLVAVGDDVVVGQPLVLVNADKTELEIEAPSNGTLHTVVVAAGEMVAVAGVLGTLDVGDTAVVVTAQPSELPPTPDVPEVSKANPVRRLTEQPPSSPLRSRSRTVSSPRARAVARQRGIDIHALVGSGPGGRIVERDVLTNPSPIGGGRGSVSVTAHLRAGHVLTRQRQERAGGRPVRMLDLLVQSFADVMGSFGADTVTAGEATSAGLWSVRPGVARGLESTRRLTRPTECSLIVVDGGENAIAEVRPELFPGCPLTVGVGAVEQRAVVRGGEFHVAEEVTLVAVADPDVWPSAVLVDLVGEVIALLETPQLARSDQADQR